MSNLAPSLSPASLDLLLIDVPAYHRHSFQEALEPCGWRIRYVETMEAGAREVLREKPQLVIISATCLRYLDNVCGQGIRQALHNLNIPFMVFTTYVSEELYQKMLSTGADDYISVIHLQNNEQLQKRVERAAQIL